MGISGWRLERDSRCRDTFQISCCLDTAGTYQSHSGLRELKEQPRQYVSRSPTKSCRVGQNEWHWMEPEATNPVPRSLRVVDAGVLEVRICNVLIKSTSEMCMYEMY